MSACASPSEAPTPEPARPSSVQCCDDEDEDCEEITQRRPPSPAEPADPVEELIALQQSNASKKTRRNTEEQKRRVGEEGEGRRIREANDDTSVVNEGRSCVIRGADLSNDAQAAELRAGHKQELA